MLSNKTLYFGEKIASITLGIDKLYRDELNSKDEKEGLVVVNMGSTPTQVISNYEEARIMLSELITEAFVLPEEDRRLYYTQACISLDSFCAYRQHKLVSLNSQVGMFLHVNPAPINELQLNNYYFELRKLLTQMGYTGSLREQCIKWEDKNKVPSDEVKDTMDELMKIAREKTGRILELPENDFYRCETVTGSAFNARSDYDNRCVEINIDPILTKQGLKHLVCHECYPGHFMQFTLRRVLYEKGLAAADGLLSVVNHSSSSTFEGIADAGIEFINWVEDDDDRVSAILGELKSALGTASSYQMHTLKNSDKEVETWLREHALVGGEGWIQGRLKFIKDTARSALIWSYWRGDQGVFDVWHRVSENDKNSFFEYIYGRLHTIQSIQLFK